MSVRRLSNSTISTQGRGKSSTFLAGYSPAIDEMDLIERVVVGSGGTSSITFSNIPQTYQHLQVRAVSFTNDTDNSGLGNVRCFGYFNSDETATNYRNHMLNGNGSSASAEQEQSAKWVHSSVRNSMIAPGVSVTDILDYSNTSKNTTTRALWGVQNNDTVIGNQLIRIVSGLWINTAAVTSLKISPESGSLRDATFSLYGVKA